MFSKLSLHLLRKTVASVLSTSPAISQLAILKTLGTIFFNTPYSTVSHVICTNTLQISNYGCILQISKMDLQSTKILHICYPPLGYPSLESPPGSSESELGYCLAWKQVPIHYTVQTLKKITQISLILLIFKLEEGEQEGKVCRVKSIESLKT